MTKMAIHIFVNFLIVLFSYGRVKDEDVFWYGSNFIWEGKRKGEEEGMGEEYLNEGYFCKIPIIKQDTNFISQTFGQTNF